MTEAPKTLKLELAKMNLKTDAITATPRYYDYWEMPEVTEGEGEGWRRMEPSWTPGAALSYLQDEGYKLDDLAEDNYVHIKRAQEHWQESNAIGMCYAYPIPSIYAEALVDTCFVGVEIDGETYLALCDGGMDFSWEICEAYIVCGYLPPSHFAELPQMASKGNGSARDKRIVSACRRSLDIHREWLEHRLQRLNSWSKETD